MIDLETVDLSQLEVRMETSKGSMVFGFYAEKAPKHARNMADLAQKGFYDGQAFHRLIKGFMIQGGCPNTKEGAQGHPGTGGPGHSIEAEFNELPHLRGVLSMARAADPNSAGSQFFVVHGEHVDSLDGQYTVFGYLKEGHDVLDEIACSPVEFGAGGEKSKPTERIDLLSMSVAMAAPEDAPQDAGSQEPASEATSEATEE